MKKEKSCGAICYQLKNQQIYFLLIQHKNGGHWAFPKGHVENNETEEETALREIFEETKLDVELNTQFRKTCQYSPTEGVSKEVVYFIAQVHDPNVQTQQSEVLAYDWLNYDSAFNRLTYANDQSILNAANRFLLKK